MRQLAALLRRAGLQPHLHGLPWASGQWEALSNGFSSLAVPRAGGGERQAAPQPAAASAAAAAASATRQPRHERPKPLQDVPAEQRAEALRVRQHMQQALARRDFDEVLQLLYEVEGLSSAGPAHLAAAGGEAVAADAPLAPAAAAGWHPYDRAALWDCALEACDQRADPEEARRLVGRMWRRQIPVGLTAHTHVLGALCAAGRCSEALQYLKTVATKRQRPAMYAVVLRSCNETGDLKLATECYEMFRRRGLAPDSRLLAEVIKMHGLAGELDAAEAVWLQADGGSPGEQACLHAAWVGALARAGQLAAATQALERMLDRFSAVLPLEVGQQGPASANGSGRGDAQPPAAAELVDTAAADATAGGGAAAGQGSGRASSTSAGGRVTPVRFLQDARNSLLAAAQGLGDRAAASKVASLATMRGLPPDAGTYNTMLHGAMAHGDGLQAVLDGIVEMRALGIRPGRQTYILLLQACAAERDTEAAEAAFQGMAEDGVAPSRLHWSALLAAYSRAGDLAGAEHAYRDMLAAGFSADAATFRLLLDSFKHWAALETAGRDSATKSPAASRERVHQRQEASQILSAWVADLDACRPSVLSQALFPALLHAYSQCGLIYQVLLLMREAFGVQLSPPTAAVLGDGARGAGSGTAESTDSTSSSSGASSSSSVPGSIHSGSTWAGAAGEAVAADQRAMDSLDAAMASSSGSSEGSEATGSSEGSRDGVPSSSPASGADAAAGADAAGVLAAAEPGQAASPSSGQGGLHCPLSRETLERAQLAPTEHVFNAAIGACTRVGHRHLPDAVALLRAMLAAGLSPDVHTYTSLIAGCAYGRQAALARELLRQMQERGIRPTSWTYNALLNVECWTYGVDAGLALLEDLQAKGAMQPDRATWNSLLAAARHYKRQDVADMALEQLEGQQRLEEEAAAEEAAAAEQAAAAALAAGEPPPEDHRWHGYYERQQEEEDEW